MINLIRKEIRELLTKSAIVFFAAMAMIFVFMGQMLSSSFEGAAARPEIAVVVQDDSEFSTTLLGAVEVGATVVYKGDDTEQARSELEQTGGLALLTIPEDFGSTIQSGQRAEIQVTWFMKGAGLADAVPMGSVQSVISSGIQAVSARMVSESSPLDPDIVLLPATSIHNTWYEGRLIENASPDAISGQISSRTIFVPIIIMMLVIMGSSSVISSMGLEKENRTLETLLTLPVRRSHIIISKIVGSAVVGLVMGAIYMVGFVSYFNSIGFSQSGSLGDFGFTLSGADYLLIALSLFAALLSALCGSIILGTFASNYRSAQTLTYPLIGLAMLAMLMTMLLDFNTLALPLQIVVFLIPFSHPMIAMKELMTGHYPLVFAGIAYSSLITAILVVIATRIFTTDRVIIGMSFKRRKPVKI